MMSRTGHHRNTSKDSTKIQALNHQSDRPGDLVRLAIIGLPEPRVEQITMMELRVVGIVPLKHDSGNRGVWDITVARSQSSKVINMCEYPLGGHLHELADTDWM